MCNLPELIQERLSCSYLIRSEINIINNKRASKKLFWTITLSIDVLGVLVFDLAEKMFELDLEAIIKT